VAVVVDIHREQVARPHAARVVSAMAREAMQGQVGQAALIL
jgi:hypothetical protein